MTEVIEQIGIKEKEIETKKEKRNVPQLRFKGFEDEWSKKTIGQISSKVGSGKTPKGGNSVYTKEGVIFIRSQNVLNGKLVLDDIAYISENENKKMQSTETKPNDILLNITGASIGRACIIPESIKKANLNQHVCIIRFENDNPIFLMEYILSNKIQKQISSFQAGGNREGLNFEQIRNMKLKIPSLQEQKKIADFLSLVDKKIEKQSEKVDALKTYKKGMMQKIFKQEIRFKDENGKEYPEWENKKLNELLFEHKIRNNNLQFNKNDVLSVSGEYGIVNQIKLLGRSYAGESVANYHVVHKGDIVYTKSPLKTNPYGIIKANKGAQGIVSTLYAVYSCKNGAYPDYLDYYFELDDNTNRYVRPLVNKGAKNDMKINNQYFLSDSIIIPCIKEQIKIADFLAVMDKKIKKEEEKLEELKTWKKGLLQKMFV